ncbi:hypothetical protein JR316_0000594 [Psilocybe cubensis]|uniref:Uncharacterized protein n=1 Tax=Psilocybe cubensis TaxID=181762 RepID=A0ACB8HH84_PSICU|nr:hypothetical protein JR316_0000594 [Psilocybe cubensis]KAH9486529.1 hypothetical protein JR316_0000594 [Psilocybe cubensis]
MDNTQTARSEDEVVVTKDNRWSPPRAHFPPNEMYSVRPSRPRMEGTKLQSGLTPPVRRGSPLNPQNVTHPVDPRRRPRPSDVLVSSDVLNRHRRTTSFTQGNLGRLDSEFTPINDIGPEGGTFSDEYDLYPRILQDVQRALKMKARREARLKREATSTPEKGSEQLQPSSALSSTPSKKGLPATFTSSSFSPSTNRKLSGSTVSEVDFSPSTAIHDQAKESHPIPSSIDNGTTLDWTGSNSDDSDKRWMGIGRKKDREKLPPLELMVAKLARIKDSLSAQTIRKAEITSDQLARRYNLIYDSIGKTGSPLNLAAVSRWYHSCPESIKASLEKAEPFTWLKHLEKRSFKNTRSKWHLTAYIMKEYILSESRHARMQTISEDLTVSDPTASLTRARSPSFVSTSRPRALSSSFSMRMPVDEQISFEPLVEINRSSLDAISRNYESRPNSLHSGSSNTGISPLSPISTRSNDDDVKAAFIRRTLERPRSPGSSFSGTSDDGNLEKHIPSSLVVPSLSVQPPSSENTPLPDPDPILKTSLTASRESSTSQVKFTPSPANQSLSSLKTSLKPRPARKDPFDDSRPVPKRKKILDREIILRQEYEMKALISAAMKDYDTIQNTSMHSQNLTKLQLPKDLLEAFGHDPSAVTGATRRDRGWRAVEDINQRVEKQRSVFRAFIQSFTDQEVSRGCIMDEPMENIVEALASLQFQKTEIGRQAEKVSSVLESVQNIHTSVKENYNSAMSHVSIVYPELSHIVALEESYKDQYQQVWELGMNALTLLLDTVTPLWRTYGKTIGEDVRDFLIVPLYRNEFTGEAKSYPINSIPKRSRRHWFGLVVFFNLSIGVNFLQLRAAISSSLHFRLHLIPYDGVRWISLPFFWLIIIIQWLAVIVEFAIVFLQLGVITWWSGWLVKFWA